MLLTYYSSSLPVERKAASGLQTGQDGVLEKIISFIVQECDTVPVFEGFCRVEPIALCRPQPNIRCHCDYQ